MERFIRLHVIILHAIFDLLSKLFYIAFSRDIGLNLVHDIPDILIFEVLKLLDVHLFAFAQVNILTADFSPAALARGDLRLISVRNRAPVNVLNR